MEQECESTHTIAIGETIQSLHTYCDATADDRRRKEGMEFVCVTI